MYIIMSCVKFTVNGQKCTVTSSTSREMSLNSYLRYVLGLPGTKAMCREGGCGACIVTVGTTNTTSNQQETFSVNSCLVLVFSCHGWDITTVEALGNCRDGYHEIQERMAAFNGTQCGYCTPGWIMQLNSLPYKTMTKAELEKSFGSNTCRCTGYRPILDMIKSFAIDNTQDNYYTVNDIEDTVICSKDPNMCIHYKKCRKLSTKSVDSDWSIVETEIHNAKDENEIEISFENNKKFFKVFEEDRIFEILTENGDDCYMFVDGNTGKGIVEDFEYPQILIDIKDVKSLKSYCFDQNLTLGANVTLEDCITIFKDAAVSRSSEFSYLEGFVDHFEKIAHIPVRKVGSLAGNLMIKHKIRSYPSDVFLLFSSVGAFVTVKHIDGSTKLITMTEFLEHDMKGALLINIMLPPLSHSNIFKSYKVMPRNQNALAVVNAAFLLKLDKTTKTINDIRIAYGNISPGFVYASKIEEFLKGKDIFSNKILQVAIKMLVEEIKPEDYLDETSPEVRKKLAIGLFYKFILSICPKDKLSNSYISGGENIKRPLSKGHQTFQLHPEMYPVNKPMRKLEALIQSSGEARYANDVPPLPREVFGAFVLSTVHSGEVDYFAASEALELAGVLAFYTAEDIPGINSFVVPGFQLETEDEEILATKIRFYGQPIAIVVAESEEVASRAAKKVKVSYKNVSSKSPVLAINEAKKDSQRFTPGEASITPKSQGGNVKKVIKGVYEIEAQYHYYMEPITCVVIPIDKMLEVYDATQWMDLTQAAIARSLKINESQVLVKVRRLGGGFGGKLSRGVQASTACALVAYKMNRPCRFILPMQTNMMIAGKRLPCQCEYEAGVDESGKIQYLNATIVEDSGCSLNENILDYTAEGFPNCYNSDTFTLKTGTVLTDLPSNTFARAPGTNEGISCMEHIMEHIAFAVQKDSTDVRLTNMKTEDNDIPGMIDELKKDADYVKRAAEIDEFNKSNRWMKKALKISVMLFPVQFYGNYSAMVSVYRYDGTVTVTTGGIEMGQGVNTKVAQVCAYEFGIPIEDVSILPSYSFVAANNVFSGSSIVSESVCYAVIKACDIIKKRLEPIKDNMKNPSWKELIKKAGEAEIDLVAKYMMNEKEPDLKNYNAFAVVVLETQMDVLTSRYEILRVDILEDVGLSTNPDIDVGQIEGAYVQGLGYYTTEKLIYDKQTGKLLTNRSLKYHVPLAQDIPADFRVKLRYNSKNPKGVLGSKAVGEMSICAANGINHALRKCITESRINSGYDETLWINIDVPYTIESIVKALDVKYEEMLLSK